MAGDRARGIAWRSIVVAHESAKRGGHWTSLRGVGDRAVATRSTAVERGLVVSPGPESESVARRVAQHPWAGDVRNDARQTPTSHQRRRGSGRDRRDCPTGPREKNALADADVRQPVGATRRREV